MSTNYLIYKVTNNITNKSYIGFTSNIDRRKLEHKSKSNNQSNFHFHNSIRKYGFENFSWKILENDLSLSEAIKIEIKLIKLHDTFNNGYNMTLGGEGNNGYTYTKRDKEKIKKNMRGKRCNKPLTKTHKEKISKANKGRVRSEQTKEKCRKARLKNSSKYKTEEYRRKLSESIKKSWIERKRKMLEAK